MAKPKGELILDIYTRTSRLGDERQRSSEGQAQDCKGRIIERGALVGETLSDPGRSAWNPRAKRPGWDELMRRLEVGETGGAVVFDLARFSRRPAEGERLIAAAERGLIILDSEGEYDLTSASGKKHFREQMNSAAYESDRLSTRVRRGKRLKAMSGESNHTVRPYGFEQDGVTHRRAEAEELRSIAARLLTGDSQSAIAVDLNARGVLTSYGNAWDLVALRQVILRPRNAGLVEHKGEIVATMPGAPILEKGDWERICAIYAARRHGRPVSPIYLCSAFVHCGRCQNRLTGRPRGNLTPYPNGEIRRQYWCHPRRGEGCGRLSIDQRELDKYMGQIVVNILADPRHATAVEAALRSAREQKNDLDKQIAEIEHTATELAARLGRGEMDLARHDAAVGPLDRRLDELRTQLARLGDMPTLEEVTPEMTMASHSEWQLRWDNSSTDRRRAMIQRALRGKKVLIMPLDRRAPRRFDPDRVVIEPVRNDRPTE
jgi:DNA invertase Pin-like site-specific DNA recombinase